MRILYVAKFRSGGNDDEGAIADAFERLGCTVTRRHELEAGDAPDMGEWDFVLFHKWDRFSSMLRCRAPLVCWYFDLVRYDDHSLATRNRRRTEYMDLVGNLCHTVFCTDGDHVARSPDHFRWLPQGADQRMVSSCDLGDARRPGTVLITASLGGGRERDNFMAHLLGRHPTATHHRSGVHGADLCREIRTHSVCVAPIAPATHDYWSNRVYLTLGYGGFLLHPYCHRLAETHKDGVHLRYYRTVSDLDDLIAEYVDCPDKSTHIAEAGLRLTATSHTYVDRCRHILAVLKDRGV